MSSQGGKSRTKGGPRRQRGRRGTKDTYLDNVDEGSEEDETYTENLTYLERTSNVDLGGKDQKRTYLIQRQEKLREGRDIMITEVGINGYF